MLYIMSTDDSVSDTMLYSGFISQALLFYFEWPGDEPSYVVVQ